MKYFKFIFILIFLNLQIYGKNNIFICANNWGDLFSDKLDHDERHLPMQELKKAFLKFGYDLIQVNSFDNLEKAKLIIVFDVPKGQLVKLKKIPKNKLILFLWEPPSVVSFNYDKSNHEYFSRIYTWKDDYIDNRKYFKFYYPALKPIINEVIDYDKKKLCVSISANKKSNHPDQLYSERLKMINFFEKNHSNDFDFYGVGWPKNLYKNYKGMVNKKVDTLKNYKFCICYENIKGQAGYITEKIFDCFHAGCVPIYLGASNIQSYVPKNCFIAREDFRTDLELYNFIKSMNKEEYSKYIQNIKNFLISDGAYLYSVDNFVKIVVNCIKSIRVINL